MTSADAAEIRIRVNGIDYVLECDPNRSLLDVLRDDLALTGAKKACDLRECGSCTVLLAGKAGMSCAIPISRVHGKNVVTIEGLSAYYRNDSPSSDSESLHPLQRAFAELGAAQCGFCIPGMIMEAEPLLRRKDGLTRESIANRLSRNMCRCTGYEKIIDAVIEASKVMEEVGERHEGSAFAGTSGAVLGARTQKPDSLDHVTGRSMYAADLPSSGALHLKLVRSPHHHARIVGIDTSSAESIPGVRFVLTARDLPKTAAMLNGRPQPFLLASEKVRFLGEAVVAVAAESEEIAAAAVTCIRVDYQVLEPVLDPVDAFSAASPLLYPPLNNWEEVSTIRLGDVEAAFAEADAVVEGTYRTAPREHAPMEPEAGLAEMEGDVLVIRSPHHHPFAAQQWIAGLVGMEKEKVRIICPAMGGSFGHRGDFLHPALLALTVARTGRRARIVYTREESLLGSGKAMSYVLKYRTAANAEGKLTAVSAEIIADGGCWILRPSPTKKSTRMSIVPFAPGPYRVPTAYIRVLEVCTSRPRSIPMRGTNIPDLAFAWESQMDLLADKLGIDRLEFRILNAIQEGDQTITGEVLDEAVSCRKTLEALRLPYARATARARSGAPVPPWYRGIGVGAIWMVMGGGRYEEAGGGWHGLKLGPAKASVGLLDSGRVRVRTGIVEKGQGIAVAIQQIAAAEVGIPFGLVTMVYGDTSLAPYPIATSGQRTMFHAGGATQAAARKLRVAMLQVAAEVMGENAADLSLESGYVSSDQSKAELAFADLARSMRDMHQDTEYEATFVFEPSERGKGPVYGYASQLVELDVNSETGEVRVESVTYVADPGRVINAQTLEGQVEGGVVMGLSYALSEAFVPGVTRSLKEYGLARAKDAPRTIETIVIEEPVVGAPFGAKGMAEMTCSGGIATVLNAVASACGARCYEAPARPEVIRAAIKSHTAGSSVRFPALPTLEEYRSS